MAKIIKSISVVIFGGMAWMLCAIILPMQNMQDTQGLMAKIADVVISQAYAHDDDEDIDFSDATLVCVSRSMVLTTFIDDDDLTETINSLPGCTEFGSPTAAGVWVPLVAIIPAGPGGNVSLISKTASSYFKQLASGTSGLTGKPADSMMMAYREIRGQ